MPTWIFFSGWRVVVTGAVLATTALAAKPARPLPEIERVVVVSIDGLRPDCLLLADTPTLHGLLAGGTYTMWAQTTAVSITLPSHVSMLTGVAPEKHGVTWNGTLAWAEMRYPKVPSVLELATRAGYVTALVAGKPKFRPLAKPDTITSAWVAEDGNDNNEAVLVETLRVIETVKPELLFVHFPDVDRSGHTEGWGTRAQRDVIAKTDRQLGRVLEALTAAGVREHTLVIVSADHGGYGLTHGGEDPRSRTIPWIAAGPGVRMGFDLTRLRELQVRTEDTAATVAFALGLTLEGEIDGRPVLPAFEEAP